MPHPRYTRSGFRVLFLALLLSLATTTAWAQSSPQIVVLDCEPQPESYLVPFAILNTGDFEVCRVIFTPLDPGCPIISSGVPPSGWLTGLTPQQGADFIALPGACVLPGQALPGFEVIVGSNQPCCYLVEFFDPNGDILSVDEVCLSPCGGEGPPASVILDNCAPVEGGVKVAFSIQNNSLQGVYGICDFHLVPTPEATCVISGPGSTPGWSAFGNPTGGADWFANTAAECIVPGETRSGFSFVVPSASNCCYTATYTDGTGAILFEEEVCFSCSPVPVEPSTWGSIKALYGSDRSPR